MSSVALKQSEKQFEAALVQYAKLAGWRVFHPFDSRRSEAGWPDLTLVRDGQLVFAELKTERGKLSTAQEEWIEALCEVEQADVAHLAGLPSGLYRPHVQVYVWRPSSWPEIEKVLR